MKAPPTMPESCHLITTEVLTHVLHMSPSENRTSIVPRMDMSVSSRSSSKNRGYLEPGDELVASYSMNGFLAEVEGMVFVSFESSQAEEYLSARCSSKSIRRAPSR